MPKGAIPAYLMDREGESRSKVLSNMIKQKRKEKAGKWSVPLPQVKGVAEDEVFKVLTTGKKRSTDPAGARGTRARPPLTVPRAVVLAAPGSCSQAVEAHGDQGHLCRRRLHAQGGSPGARALRLRAHTSRGARRPLRRDLPPPAAQVRALHPPDGPAVQEGPRDAPGAQDHVRGPPARAGAPPLPRCSRGRGGRHGSVRGRRAGAGSNSRSSASRRTPTRPCTPSSASSPRAPSSRWGARGRADARPQRADPLAVGARGLAARPVGAGQRQRARPRHAERQGRLGYVGAPPWARAGAGAGSPALGVRARARTGASPGKYAQVTNHPENDGCINAVLLV